MNGTWGNALARVVRLDERPASAAAPATEMYKQGVAGVSAEIILWSAEAFTASFYLRLSSASGVGRETLGERLNDPGTRFIPCKAGDRIELLNLDWISFIRLEGQVPEIAQREELGAIRQPAKITMQSGYLLEGQFLYVLPHARARLSDLLNFSTDRFLLFLAPAAVLYVNRKSIVRVAP